MSKNRVLKKSYRIDFTEKDIESLNAAGRKSQIKEILVLLRKWGDVGKWRSRWTRKKESPANKGSLAFPIREEEELVLEAPMREVAGGNYVHVPWTRQDIFSFTNDFPKLREKPVEWYRQVDRFVKVSKVLLKDLDGLLDIVVPVALWTECKITVGWPTEVYPRDKKTGAPSPEVMRKYEHVIRFLQNKIPAKETDWVKIDRTLQEPKE